MVTTSNYTLSAIGRQTGRTYSISGFISDVTQTYTKLSQSGLAVAGSPDNFIAPEDLDIIGMAVTTGPTVIKVLGLEVNGNTVGSVFDIIAYVSTSNNRPPVKIGIGKGSTVRLKEI